MPTMMVPPSTTNESGEQKNKKPKITPVFTIFEEAVSSWWKNINKILLIYWEALKTPATFLLVVIGLLIISSFLKQTILSLILALALGVAFFYYFLRAYMAIYLLVKNNFEGEAKKLFQETKSLFWPYLGLSLLTGLLISLWALLLLIPGIIFAVFYSLVDYVFFSENKRGMEAIKRSKFLVKGYFWPVFGRVLLLGVIFFIFMSIISWPMDSTDNKSFLFLWNIIVQVISFLTAPIALIFIYRIYNDLVKIKK